MDLLVTSILKGGYTDTLSNTLFEMTLNYWRIVERQPKPNEVVGGSIPDCEIFSLLDGKISQVATCLMCSKNEKTHF